jgi:integrase
MHFNYLEAKMIYKKNNSKYWYTKFEMEYQGIKKRIHKSTRHTSKAKAESYEVKLKQDLWLSMTTTQIKQYYLKEAIELHLLSRQVNRSFEDKERKLNWWCKKLKNPVLSELSTHLILSEISKKHDISLATRNRYLAELKSLLNFCHKELGWIDKVPVLKILKEPKRSFFKLSSFDVKNLLKASPDYLRPIIAFALLTGLRRGNILSLRWSQIDFDRGCLFIAANEHKSKDHVTTPLCRQAMELLLHLKSKSTSSFVFTTPMNIPLNEVQHTLWSKVIKKANVEGLRFHDLRHNWATKHIEAGTDLLALKELGGWKTLEMVQRYAHPSDDYLSQQAKNIDSRTHFPSFSSFKNDVTSNCDKLIRDEESSHLDIIERKFENLTVIGEKTKIKNLMIFSRLFDDVSCDNEKLENKGNRILNPPCIPISSRWLYLNKNDAKHIFY